MVGGHVYLGGFIWITVDAQGDFITSFQVEHPTSVQATMVINTWGRTIRKLIGGAGEVQKKYSRKGKLNEKKFVHAN